MKIGIFSDYPATDKLAAMGLAAHHVVAASDVGLLKPHATGLQSLMTAASATAHDTLFIGDRADRDGVAGQRAGVRILRAKKEALEWLGEKRPDVRLECRASEHRGRCGACPGPDGSRHRPSGSREMKPRRPRRLWKALAVAGIVEQRELLVIDAWLRESAVAQAAPAMEKAV